MPGRVGVAPVPPFGPGFGDPARVIAPFPCFTHSLFVGPSPWTFTFTVTYPNSVLACFLQTSAFPGVAGNVVGHILTIDTVDTGAHSEVYCTAVQHQTGVASYVVPGWSGGIFPGNALRYAAGSHNGSISKNGALAQTTDDANDRAMCLIWEIPQFAD